MKRKGFTLIELLAVIVILAIIALIATPIVLNIISDTKESATIRSAENYISAVEQAVAAKQLDGNAFNPDTCTTLDNGNLLCGEETLEVNFSGNKPASGAIIKFNKGSIIGISNFKIVDKEIIALSLGLGTIIYRYSTDTINIGDTIDPTTYTSDSSTLGTKFYLKHVLNKDNKVIESYACDKFRGNEVCLQGQIEYGYATNVEDYTGNVKKLKDFQNSDFFDNGNWSCSFEQDVSFCEDVESYFGEFMTINDENIGYVYSNGSGTYSHCYVYEDGSSYCKNS